MVDVLSCFVAGCVDLRYWAWFGTIYLLVLTWKDLRNNMLVDDRYNFLMLGISVSLYSHLHPPVWYILVLALVVYGLGWAFDKFKVLGGADVSTLRWIFLGLGIISVYKLAWFAFFFLLISGLYFFLKLKVFKYDRPAPFYPVLLLSFMFNSWLFGLY